MAITREQNDLITLVEGAAPLGAMLRQHYWIPAYPASAVEADGKPIRVRLMGKNYVVFRDTSGSVGILDELCPHRQASLALGRNEHNGLRCLYHGWKFDVGGNVVDVPNVEGEQSQQRFCRSLRVNKYIAEERGGIIWVWLGQGDVAPMFPNLPFTDLPLSHVAVTSQVVPTNWLQGVEASMDTTHVSWLHQSSIEILTGGTGPLSNTNVARTAKLEFEERPYGFRYAAIRNIDEGHAYARVNNFVTPWYGVICPEEEGKAGTAFFSVPIDDVTHRAWVVPFNRTHPVGMSPLTASPDVTAWPPLPPGPPEDNWGQNRDAMRRGHYTGFEHIVTEDFAIFLSQGPLPDRSKEQLCAADGAVVRLRRIIERTVREFTAGEVPYYVANDDLDYSKATSVGVLITDPTKSWRTMVT